MTLTSDRSALPPLEALYLRALAATTTRDFRGAINSYQEISRQASDSEKLYAYLDLGHAYEKNDEIERAIESYIEATNLYRQYAPAFLRLGMIYGRQQNLPTPRRLLTGLKLFIKLKATTLAGKHSAIAQAVNAGHL